MTEQLFTSPHNQPAATTAGECEDGLATVSSIRNGKQSRLLLTDRDELLLRWIGEQYCIRGDLLAVLMAQYSTNPTVRTAGRVDDSAVRRRVIAWRSAGLVATEQFRAKTPATIWLTADGMATAGLGWRATAPTFTTIAHRHAVGVVRAWVEGRGKGYQWISERELRDELDQPAGGRRDHLADGVVLSTAPDGRPGRSAIEVELTRKTKGRVEQILRGLLARYDDVIYFAVPSAAGTVAAAAQVVGAAERVRVRSYPPETLAAVA